MYAYITESLSCTAEKHCKLIQLNCNCKVIQLNKKLKKKS